MSEQHEGADESTDRDDAESDPEGGVHASVIVTPGRRHRVWPWLVSLLLLGGVVAAFIVPMPYYVDGPGSVSPTQPLVAVSGRPSYPSKGTVMFTTVSQRRATPVLLLQAWLDDTIDTVPEKVAVPTGNRTTERRVEQRQMDRSKLSALIVAFERLDIPLTITGSGALIQQVNEGFPSSDLLQAGDVIVSVDGQKVSTLEDVSSRLATKKIDDVVAIGLRRQGTGDPVVLSLTLGRNEKDLTRGYLGVVLSTFDEDVRMPFEITLDSGKVVGPSAGLAWTLAVIDRLTPGDLTHGKQVAVTGTIATDGTVGPIGGIAQKVAGAKDAGATLFLYPASTNNKELERVRKIAGDDIAIKPVATVDDALEILDPRGLGAGEKASPTD